MHATIRFPAHVDKVHRLVNLLAAADNDILKALESSSQIPLDKVVQAFTHQGVVLVRVKAAMVTGDTYKGDSNKVFAQLCDELRNQLGHTLDLLNDVLLVGHSDRLMDIAGNLISVCPDDAILAGMSAGNLDDTVKIPAHHFPANVGIICIPIILHGGPVMDVVQTDQQVVVRLSHNAIWVELIV